MSMGFSVFFCPFLSYQVIFRWRVGCFLFNFGVLGNPIFLVVDSHIWMWILPLLCIPLFFIKEEDVLLYVSKQNTQENIHKLNRVIALILLVLLPLGVEENVIILGFGNLLLLPISLVHVVRQKHTIETPMTHDLLWVTSVVVIMNISILGGSAELLSWGLEEIQYNYAGWIPFGIGVFAFVASLLLDSMVVILLGMTVFLNSLDFTQGDIYFIFPLSMGCILAFFMHILMTKIEKKHSFESISENISD